MAPAIKLAREGFALTYEDAGRSPGPRTLAHFPESKRIFQRDGNPYQPGDILRQPDLARTLERIAKNPDDFYHGALAQELSAAMQKGGGLITAGDLASYEVKERKAHSRHLSRLRHHQRAPAFPGGHRPSRNSKLTFDLNKYGNRSADAIHLATEAFRRAFFDRAEFLGDPEFAKIPVAQLIDKRYAAGWRESIDAAHASPSKDLRRPAVFNELETYAVAHPLLPTPAKEPSNTTHYSVVDPAGDAVAVTTTLNDSFGSHVTAGVSGFCPQ